MTRYANPGSSDSNIEVKDTYGHWINNEWRDPIKGEYFDNPTPVTGEVFTRVARGTAEDIDAALDAAHAAADAWGKTSPAERANILNQIADRIEANLEDIAVIETWDNGKAVRETLNADIPLAIDHFRYFAGCIRAQEGGLSQLDDTSTRRGSTRASPSTPSPDAGPASRWRPPRACGSSPGRGCSRRRRRTPWACEAEPAASGPWNAVWHHRGTNSASEAPRAPRWCHTRVGPTRGPMRVGPTGRAQARSDPPTGVEGSPAGQPASWRPSGPAAHRRRRRRRPDRPRSRPWRASAGSCRSSRAGPPSGRHAPPSGRPRCRRHRSAG